MHPHQVSGAEAHELSTDTELTGHVRMGFEEVAELTLTLPNSTPTCNPNPNPSPNPNQVAEVAHKLRARPGSRPD